MGDLAIGAGDPARFSLVADLPAVAPPGETRVARVVRLARALGETYREPLRDDESILSRNEVTGYAINFPIAGTCRPTKVCATSCYFAFPAGATTWPNSLKKQLRTYRSTVDDPIGTGDRIIREYDKKRLDFLRWNGGGDLFPESVVMLNHVQATRPDVVNWVVTRIPEMAARVDPGPNTYVHFSLDRSSMPRKAALESSPMRTPRYFFSYQAEKGESPDPKDVTFASVIFLHNYGPARDAPDYGAALCPLNVAKALAGACGSCRRCFDGSAVAHRLAAG